MNYAAIKNCDIANGPGVRVSLFVSGCTHHCKGCFNAVAWDFDYGTPYTEDTEQLLLDMLKPSHIKGVTLLGGEPFEPQNQPTLLKFLKKMKQQFPDKTVWAYSGYLFDEHILPGKLGDPEITHQLISLVDVLVDGPFIETQKDLMLRFRGSSNQRIIDVQKSLPAGSVVLWEDWQGNERGRK